MHFCLSKDKCGDWNEKDEPRQIECDLFDDTVNYHYLDRVWSAAYSVINTVQT